MTKSSSASQRLLVPDMQTLRQAVGRTLRTPETKRWQEHVYFDTAHPSLPFGGFVRARRSMEQAQSAPFPREATYRIELCDGRRAPRVLRDRARIDEVPALVRDRFGAERLAPRFGVRFKRRHFGLKGLDLDVDRDVTYYSLLGTPLLIGGEESPRICARLGRQGRDVRRLGAWVNSLPIAPFTTKKWMGYHFFKQCYEFPRYDELPGFEYELKLSVDRIEIDLGRIPFPVLEVHQSDSLRGYYESFRACIRGDRAHAVEKGPVTEVRGVLKRPERKTFGLVPWELPSPMMLMRRYKREVNVFNPDTLRVYTLSIHHCDAGRTMQQLEIEYDGVLLPGATAEMARFGVDQDPSHFLQMAHRADSMGWGSMVSGLMDRHRRLVSWNSSNPPIKALPESTELDRRLALRASPNIGVSKVDPAVEQAVIEDMLLLRDALIRSYGFRQTTKSKRKWLTKLHTADARTP